MNDDLPEEEEEQQEVQ